MAEQKKRRKRVKGTTTSGRVTPPGGSSDRQAASTTVAMKRRRKLTWLVPVLMFGFFGLGVATIILNYLPDVLPGGGSPWYLLGGLGMICLGFVAATKYQ